MLKNKKLKDFIFDERRRAPRLGAVWLRADTLNASTSSARWLNFSIASEYFYVVNEHAHTRVDLKTRRNQIRRRPRPAASASDRWSLASSARRRLVRHPPDLLIGNYLSYPHKSVDFDLFDDFAVRSVLGTRARAIGHDGSLIAKLL